MTVIIRRCGICARLLEAIPGSGFQFTACVRCDSAVYPQRQPDGLMIGDKLRGLAGWRAYETARADRNPDTGDTP